MNEQNPDEFDETDPDDEGDEDDPVSDELSRNQVCAYLRISMSKLRRLEDKGRIAPTTPPNQKAYFDRRDVQRLREELNAEKAETSEAIMRQTSTPSGAAIAAAHVTSNAVNDMVQSATVHADQFFKLAISAMSASNAAIMKNAEIANSQLQKELARAADRIVHLETRLDEQQTAFEAAQRTKLVEEDLAAKRDFNQRMIMRGVTLGQMILSAKMNPIDREKTKDSAVGNFIASLTDDQRMKIMSLLAPDQQAFILAMMQSALDQETAENTTPANPGAP